MIFRGLLGTEYSGRIDGLVAARNRGTPYFRTLGPTPVPPSGYSRRQALLQQAMALANANWQSMSYGERAAWDLWASQQLRSNRDAARHTRTGWNEYARWATPRLYANAVLGSLALPVPTTAPVGAQGPLQTPPQIQATAYSTAATVTFNPADLWATADGAALLVYVSKTIAPTQNRAYGGFQLLDVILGSSGSPPVSPYAVTLRSAPDPDFKVYARFRATYQDRGMSFETRAFAIAS